MNAFSEPSRFGTIHDAPVHMLPPERVLLYSMVFGTRPERCLEIGTLHGGSAMITVAALDDIGRGKLVCIDPEPQVTPETWAGVEHRATLLKGFSPQILAEAEKTAGGKFEVALIDGDHSHAGVIRDVVGVMDVLAEGGYMLMHDAHYDEVRAGIDELLSANPDRLVDCGMLSSPSTPDADSDTVEWGGIRVLRMASRAARPVDLGFAAGAFPSSAETSAVLGLLAAAGKETALVLGEGTPAELAERTGASQVSGQALLDAAKAAQSTKDGPLIVLGAGCAATAQAVLDDVDVERGRLLIFGTGDAADRAAVEAVPWLSWTRVRHLDLEYVPPRAVEGPVQGLVGGLGLIVLDAQAAAATNGGRTTNFAPMAQVLPDLISAGVPSRLSNAEIEAGRRAQTTLAEVTSSLSWRLTAPLRAANAALRRHR
jgi:predicted O-methyltransferase YrrM